MTLLRDVRRSAPLLALAFGRYDTRGPAEVTTGKSKAILIGTKAVKPYLIFAIVVFAASTACAQAQPARAEKAYLHCLLAHTFDEPSGDEEKSVLMMVLHKCVQEFNAYMDECEATGATNCFTAAGTMAHFAFRSKRK